jgi:hypothetical protein
MSYGGIRGTSAFRREVAFIIMCDFSTTREVEDFDGPWATSATCDGEFRSKAIILSLTSSLFPHSSSPEPSSSRPFSALAGVMYTNRFTA